MTSALLLLLFMSYAPVWYCRYILSRGDSVHLGACKTCIRFTNNLHRNTAQSKLIKVAAGHSYRLFAESCEWSALLPSTERLITHDLRYGCRNFLFGIINDQSHDCELFLLEQLIIVARYIGWLVKQW